MKESNVYISVCENKVKWENFLKEKYFEIFNDEQNDFEIEKNQFGKPISNKVFFSVSHSKNLLAISFSKKIETGIDIQLCKLKVSPKKLANKILTNNELNEIKDFSENTLIRFWTKKESIFKLLGNEKTFHPNKIETKQFFFLEKEIEFDDKKYYLTISSNKTFNFIFI